jgi:uncharacterized protein YbjT (DUF2867 family)
MATILLTGANGSVSSATIRALQSTKQHRLVGLVRNAAKAKDLEALGVELRVGDLTELRSVENAFRDVDTAFLLTPPGPLAPIQASNALWGARQGGVKHVVRMSAVGAAHDAPTLNSRMHALSDSELERSGIRYTILKPHAFTQNLMMAAESVAKEGVLHWTFGEAKVPMIDVRDIADVAAAILGNPAPHAGKTYQLTGGTAVSMNEVAAALAEALGKPVKGIAVPVAATVEAFAKMGADNYTQVAVRDYFTAYSQGWQSQVTPFVKEITGKDPRGIAAFARDFAAALGKR